jgi:two-component system chemotaxis sensor kinase CheA
MVRVPSSGTPNKGCERASEDEMPRELDADTRIILSFIAEGYERLDDAEAQLNQLGDARDAERLNSVFRLFHSVKGSAAFLGFENIKKLTHEAEALIELFIKRKLSVSPESLDVIFATVDSLRDMNRRVGKGSQRRSLRR